MSETGEGLCTRGCTTPHPARARIPSARATLSRKGRGKRVCRAHIDRPPPSSPWTLSKAPHVCAGRAGAPVFFFKAPGTPVVPALALSEGMAERRAAHQPWSCPHAHSAHGRLAALHRGVFTTASGRAFRAGARPAAVSRLPAGTRSGPGRSSDAARGRAGEARTRAPRPSPAKQRPAERPLRGRDECENIPRLRREYDGDDHFTIGSGGPSLQDLREPQACLPSQYWDISRWPGR